MLRRACSCTSKTSCRGLPDILDAKTSSWKVLNYPAAGESRAYIAEPAHRMGTCTMARRLSVIIHPIVDCSIPQHSRVYVVAAKTSNLADADTLQPFMISALQLIPHSWLRFHCYEHNLVGFLSKRDVFGGGVS